MKKHFNVILLQNFRCDLRKEALLLSMSDSEEDNAGNVDADNTSKQSAAKTSKPVGPAQVPELDP